MTAEQAQRIFWLSAIRAQDSKNASYWNDTEVAGAYIVATNPGISLEQFAAIASLDVTAQQTNPTQEQMDDANARFIAAMKAGQVRLPIKLDAKATEPEVANG